MKKFHVEFIAAKLGFVAINCKMQIGTTQYLPISVNSKNVFKKVEKPKKPPICSSINVYMFFESYNRLTSL